MNEEDGPAFPIVVVTSDLNRPAILSLVGKASDITFDRLEDAVSVARTRGRDWLDS